MVMMMPRHRRLPERRLLLMVMTMLLEMRLLMMVMMMPRHRKLPEMQLLMTMTLLLERRLQRAQIASPTAWWRCICSMKRWQMC